MFFVLKSSRDKFLTHRRYTHDNVQHLVGKTRYKDLTTTLFDLQNGLQHYEIDGNCSTLIITGGETTTTALSAMLYCPTQNENAKRKVLGEIRSTVNSFGGLSSISVNQPKYLSACINYALRNFSPGPAVLLRRWTLHATASIAAADTLSIQASFIPEQWLGDPVYQNDDHHAMRAFSYGHRNCIGHDLAWLEMRLVLPRLIWEFDWELAPGSDRWKDVLVFKACSTKPLKIKFTPALR
ncbi:hypothetical protein CNMCM5623_002844 [Aspergillus felis]|uniref:Cytochrome P450 n=1 Tax=Aspergillus felis TaxID=1287682 RepID=A0A8H6PPZ1_9EURO|nr:hypothetical protein CNMCM5623_002844 [Aspergillus felis]